MKYKLLITLLLAAIGGGVWVIWHGPQRAKAEPLRPAAEWRLENVEPLTLPGGFAAPVWSPDGGALAFVSERGTHRFVLPEKSLRNVAPTRAGYKFFWMRDGKALAYRAHTPDKPLRIERLDIADGRLAPLAEGIDLGLPQETGAGLLQFRDGAEMRLLRADTGAPATDAPPRGYVYQFRDDIYFNANGATRKLTAGDGQYFLPQLSPDGQKVLYQELTSGLRILDLASGRTLNLGAGTDPAWSPDSRFVVFEITRDDGHNITSSDLFAADSSGRRRQLTDTPDKMEMNPAWSPDGKFIAFDADGVIYRAAVKMEERQ
jgi:dipeptidyl aminopeptidase/acylaminoacyl peptidase